MRTDTVEAAARRPPQRPVPRVVAAFSSPDDRTPPLEVDRDVVALLGRLYETGRIGEEARKLMAAAPAGSEATAYNQATQTLEGLIAAYDKTRSTLNGILGVLTLVKAPLVAAVPWGLARRLPAGTL